MHDKRPRIQRLPRHRVLSRSRRRAFVCWWAGSFWGQYSGVVVQKFLKDLGRVWVRASASFLPTAQRGESDVEIMLLQDRDGGALGQPVPLAPGLEFMDRRADFASSHVGGKRSASSELLIPEPVV